MSENQVKRSLHLSNLFSCLYSLPSYLQVASTNRHSRQLKKLYSINQFHLCRVPSLLHRFIRMMPGNLKAADIAPPETSWMRRGKWWKNATNELALKPAHLFINISENPVTTIRLRESALCPWGCNKSPTVSDLKTRMYSGVSRFFLWNLLKSGNARTCKTHRFTTRSFGLFEWLMTHFVHQRLLFWFFLVSSRLATLPIPPSHCQMFEPMDAASELSNPACDCNFNAMNKWTKLTKHFSGISTKCRQPDTQKEAKCLPLTARF